MQVTLMHHTPLYIAAHGARTCWESHDKSDTDDMQHDLFHWKSEDGVSDEDFITKWGKEPSIDLECGPADCSLIDRVGNKFKHKSILEHVSYNFFIEGVSRALLQELARHRIASYSVKSTRYTLKELKEAPDLYDLYDQANKDDHDLYTTLFWKVCSEFLVSTDIEVVDWASCTSLMRLQKVLLMGISNDKAKYCLPEAYKTTVQWSINARSLQNFLSLRTDKSALWEIRDLAHAVYDALPADHQYLFTDYVHQSN